MASAHSRIRSMSALANAASMEFAAILLALSFAASVQGQQAQPLQASPEQNHGSQTRRPEPLAGKPISEEDLRARFEGKSFYLRGGYGGDNLRFDTRGAITGASPQVPYTLNMVEIHKVRLGKHTLQMEAIRYGIHFLGADSDRSESGTEKLRITPKKKVVRISIERAQPTRKDKHSKASRHQAAQPEPESTGQAAADRVLYQALDRVFSPDLDERMIAALPDYWQAYYRMEPGKLGYKPSNPSVLRQSAVDQKARLLANLQPPSNDFAQKAGIVGVAQYQVVVGPDGRPTEIAIGRPIGFGLDENAVASIRKASFQPAMKEGKPVPVLVDLVVQFRIYSKRTGTTSQNEAVSATLSEPQGQALPGPYSANHPATGKP